MFPSIRSTFWTFLFPWYSILQTIKHLYWLLLLYTMYLHNKNHNNINILSFVLTLCSSQQKGQVMIAASIYYRGCFYHFVFFLKYYFFKGKSAANNNCLTLTLIWICHNIEFYNLSYFVDFFYLFVKVELL